MRALPRRSWEDDQLWYAGVVREYCEAAQLHTVVYDDGDQRDEPLNFDGEVGYVM